MPIASAEMREVLERLVGEQADVVAEELEQVAHVAGLLARAHGVSAHCTATISASAIRASPMASRLAATNSVLAPVWIALKIGAPSRAA